MTAGMVLRHHEQAMYESKKKPSMCKLRRTRVFRLRVTVWGNFPCKSNKLFIVPPLSTIGQKGLHALTLEAV